MFQLYILTYQYNVDFYFLYNIARLFNIIFIHIGTTIVHSGQESSYLVEDLDPYTEYSFRLRLLHGCDRSPFSAVVIARTLEGG